MDLFFTFLFLSSVSLVLFIVTLRVATVERAKKERANKFTVVTGYIFSMGLLIFTVSAILLTIEHRHLITG